MDLKQRTVFRGEDGELYKTIRPPRASVKVWKDETEDGVEATHVRVPISSTSEDRDGDEFAEEGLDHMIEQLQAGDVPMFLDHGISPETGFQDYRALEAVGGWKDGEKEDGVVYGIGALDPDHEDAETLAKRLENGVVPIGWSVGFIPHDTESKGEDEGERFLEHDLLEVSSVGIPSNPDGVSASIAQAAKSYARSKGVDVDAEQLAKDMTESLERAIEKADDDALELVASAVETFLEETDVESPTISDFVEWAQSTKDDAELDAIAAVLEEAFAETDEPGDEPIDALQSYVESQLSSDDDEDDEEGEEEAPEDEPDPDDDEEGDDGGDGDEGDEDEEEEDSVDDGDDGQTITTDDVDAIASAVGDAVGRELAEHRETLLEELGTEPDETDSDDEDDEDDEEGEEDDAPDSSTTSSSSTPRALASFTSSDGQEERDADDEETEKQTGEPAGPRFNPGTDQ